MGLIMGRRWCGLVRWGLIGKGRKFIVGGGGGRGVGWGVREGEGVGRKGSRERHGCILACHQCLGLNVSNAAL